MQTHVHNYSYLAKCYWDLLSTKPGSIYFFSMSPIGVTVSRVNPFFLKYASNISGEIPPNVTI